MPRKHHHLRELRAYKRWAFDRGSKQTSLKTWAWHIAGQCTDPVRVEIAGAPTYVERFMGEETSEWLDLDVRCRRCEACLKYRRILWSARARQELLASPRTWLCTLTLNPHHHFVVSCQAESELNAQGVQWSALSRSEQFIERHKVISRELTLFLKRVRKRSGARLRYLLVAEAHKSGLPHYHLLLHEYDGAARYADLTSSWKWGFTHFKLVDKDNRSASSYVAKYLGKSALARVRASISYGDVDLSGAIIGSLRPSVKFRPTKSPST